MPSYPDYSTGTTAANTANFYLKQSYGTDTTTTDCWSGIIYTQTAATYVIESPITSDLSMVIEKKKSGIHPVLYFKFVKSKMKALPNQKAIEHKLRGLERAFDKMMRSGHVALGEKFFQEWCIKAREAQMLAVGVRHWVERADVAKHRHKIMDGKIADTMLKDYVRAIPDKVLKRIQEVDRVFDDFVIFHYWNVNAQPDVKTMTPKEETKMRDPIVFGIIKETDRLYFVADWEDHYCNLTFSKLTDVVARQELV